MSKKRLDYFDYAKGILIILVVLGHCISYGNGATYMSEETYYSNLLYKIIYSFHMPAFSLLSGYFMFFSINKLLDTKMSLVAYVHSRFIRLILPIAVWTFVRYFIGQLLFSRFTIIGMVYSYITDFLFGTWYLWATFISSVIICIVSRCCKDRLWVYLALIIFMLVLPDFEYAEFKFVFPFYLIGYKFAKNKDYFFDLLKKNVFVFIIINILLYAVSMYFYKDNTYIYTVGYSIGNSNCQTHMYHNAIRFVAGLSGSMIFIFGLYFLPSLDKVSFKPGKLVLSGLSSLGRRTLGIYILSAYINFGIRYFYADSNGFDIWHNILQTIIVCAISFIVVWFLEKWKWTNRLFLGGKWNK